MLTTTRRDQRTRRQALFTLESLDDRLVLSAGAAGAAAAEAAGAASTSHAALVAQRHEAKLERMHARHEAKLARIEARHEARLAAHAAVHPILSAPTAIPVTAAASASASAATSAASTATAGSTSSSGSGTAISASPSSSGGASVSALAVTTSPTPSQSPGPLAANVSSALQSLYTEFENAGSGTFTPSQPSDKLLQISGSNVEVTLKVGSSTDFNTALSQLQSDGMQVTSSSSTYGLIDGMLPISELPAVAQLASSVNPVPPPTMR